MAKAPDKQEKPAAVVAPVKKKKLLLIILIGMVLLLLVGGGAAFILLKKHQAAGVDGEAVAEKHEKPTFVKLESFTVKLQPDDGKQEQQFMQTVPELKVRDALVAENVKNYMPEIRHKFLLLLSSRKPSDLSTPQGMEKLATDLRSVSNIILDGPKKPSKQGGKDKTDGDDSVLEVLFSTFIVQ